MTTVYFVLVRHSAGTDFWMLQSHLCGEGVGKAIMQKDTARRYLELQSSASNSAKATVSSLSPSPSLPPWSRYVRAMLSQDKLGPKAYWTRDLAPIRRLPSYMTATPLREDVADRPAHAFPREVTLDGLGLGRLSSEANVSVPVFAEAVFALAVGLYWSQRSAQGPNLVLYTKPVQSEYC